jgi:hypothetical protein
MPSPSTAEIGGIGQNNTRINALLALETERSCNGSGCSYSAREFGLASSFEKM